MNKKNRAKEQARLQVESIVDMISRLNDAQKQEDDDLIENISQEIHEDPLSVETRSNWHSPGKVEPDGEFMILLCTGGPAVRIVGELTEYGEPESAFVEFQDWGTYWERFHIESPEENDMVLQYCSEFYFSG